MTKVFLLPFFVCVCARVHTRVSVHVYAMCWPEYNLQELVLFPSCEFWVLNLGPQPWWQLPLSPESSPLPPKALF